MVRDFLICLKSPVISRLILGFFWGRAPCHSFLACPRCLGGYCWACFFLSQSVQRIDEWQASIAVVRAKNLPFGEVLLALSLIAMLFGSMGLVSGFQTRFSALALAVCTGAWIMLAHDFWMFQDSEQRAFHYQAFALDAAIYGPPEHIDGTVHITSADARTAHEHFDGKTTE